MKKMLFMSMLCLTLTQQVFTNEVIASELEPQQSIKEIEDVKDARKDIIEMRFRTYNGIKQYRRLNTTRNCWVDATWKNY